MKRTLKHLSSNDFITLLPPGSREIANQRIDKLQNPLELIFEISAQPGAGLATKGQSLWPRQLIEHIMREIHLVICTEDPKYADLRKQVNEQKKISAAVLVTMLGTAIGTHVDALAGICTPLITWVMAVLAKTGVEGWCAAYSEQLKAGDPPDVPQPPPAAT